MMLALNKYQRWLRGLVHKSGPSYDILFDIAWVTRYVAFIPNDVNRAVDGTNLRRRFEYETSLRLPELGECTVLEFLIGLAIRLNETVYNNENPNQEAYWFWVLIENLQLDAYTDFYPFKDLHHGVQMAFEILNDRLYATNGHGGLFPLKNTEEDQRHVEVWYQMQAYLHENT